MIHPTAIVEKGAEIDSSVEIGPWCVIGPRVKIGEGTRLTSHVVVEGDTRIGKKNTIFPFVVLGGVPQDLKYKGESTRLEIGDRNVIRELLKHFIDSEVQSNRDIAIGLTHKMGSFGFFDFRDLLPAERLPQERR